MTAALASLGGRPRIVSVAPTFSREVVRILQQHCQECHRPGGIAPFPLMNYAEVAPRAYQIAAVTLGRCMPPWKPLAGCGDFQDERRLSEKELATISRWVTAGAREGDRSHLPPQRTFAEGWSLGPTDLITGMQQIYWPPPHSDTFRCFVLPSPSSQEIFVEALDFRSLARENVHHILVYVDESGTAERLDSEDDIPGYECLGGPKFVPSALLGGWFPGAKPLVLPAGVSGHIRPQSKIVMQVHYHAHSAAIAGDITEIGLYRSQSSPARTLRFLAAENMDFIIPAGATAHPISAAIAISDDIDVHAIGAHMHRLGRAFRVEAESTDGVRRCLLEIGDWDPSWQGMYSHREPVRLEAGSRILASATYDNSANNPRNPHSPPQDVVWGEQAFNEMLSAYIAYSLAGGE